MNTGNEICGFKYVKISCGRPAVGTSRLMGICRWRGSTFATGLTIMGFLFYNRDFSGK